MFDEQKPDVGLRTRRGRCASCPKRHSCRCQWSDHMQTQKPLTSRLQNFIVRNHKTIFPVYDRYGRLIGVWRKR